MVETRRDRVIHLQVEHAKHGVLFEAEDNHVLRFITRLADAPKVKAFRPGKWLDALERLAVQIAEAQEANEAAKRAAEEAEAERAEAAAFEPLDEE